MPELKKELSQSCEAIVRHMQDFEEHTVVQLYGCAVFAAMTADCKSTNYLPSKLFNCNCIVPSLSSQLAAAGVIGMISEVMRNHSKDSSVLLWAIKALANMTVDGECIASYIHYCTVERFRSDLIWQILEECKILEGGIFW